MRDEKKKTYIGYMGVSCREQNEDRQRTALMEMGVLEENIYMNKMSGKDFERPKYKKMLEKPDSNSVLFIKSIDRLGRNYSEWQKVRFIIRQKYCCLFVWWEYYCILMRR